MKFSKSLLVVCVLMGAQTVSLLGIRPGGAKTEMAKPTPAQKVNDMAVLNDFLNKDSDERTQADFDRARKSYRDLMPFVATDDNVKRLIDQVGGILVPELPVRDYPAPALPARDYPAPALPSKTYIPEAGLGAPMTPVEKQFNDIVNYMRKPMNERSGTDFEAAQDSYHKLSDYLEKFFEIESNRVLGYSRI